MIFKIFFKDVKDVASEATCGSKHVIKEPSQQPKQAMISGRDGAWLM